jgi:general secretion pathway protein A
MIRDAAGEVYGRSFNPPWFKLLIGSAGGVAVLGLALGVWQLMRTTPAESQEVAAEAPAVVAPAPTQQLLPVAEVEAPRPKDVAEVLVEKPGLTNTESAFSQLFALWGGKFNPAAGRPCDQAQQQGLECVYQQGSWGQLRTLNRPAILTLIDDEGNAHQLVVSGLIGETAKINLPDETTLVSIASLSRLWYGDYLVLWRPQVASPRALSAGMQGDGVRWLRSQLNTVSGKAEAPASDFYDEDLVKMVEDFQRQYRLNVDGIAGVQTQIVLDALGNSGGSPVLIAQAGSGRGAS